MASNMRGLVFTSDDTPGLRRTGAPGRFGYRDAHGRALKAKATLERIKKLAIPPAWTDVWIAPKANAHLQASGRDARGRKQYRYHADFRAKRDAAKFDHMLDFVRRLPAIRAQVARDLKREGLPREKVLAAIVWLLQTTLIRVGNEEYSTQNGSFGLTTLKDRHAAIRGSAVKFTFKGKSGKEWRVGLSHPRVAKIVRSAQELPGQHLFQYEDETGAARKISSTDVNAYLREISGADVTAKDFRTWAGTVLACLTLAARGAVKTKVEAKAVMRGALDTVAGALRNTPAVCRASYIHPQVFAAFEEGVLRPRMRRAVMGARGKANGLDATEKAVLALLKARATKPAARAR